MEKVVLGLAYFSPVLPLYTKPSHQFAPYISGLVSIQWYHWPRLQGGCLVKANINLQIDVLIFISNSIFHFSLSCFEKNYDLRLKVAKKLLSTIFKFHMISAQFFIDFMTSFVDIVNLLLYLSIVNCQKRKNFTGVLSRSCLTFKIFSLSSCLAIAQVLT